MAQNLCMISMSGRKEYPTPPLVWLLDGAVEHVWTGQLEWEHRASHVESISATYFPFDQPDYECEPRVERAELDASKGYALGPFQVWGERHIRLCNHDTDWEFVDAHRIFRDDGSTNHFG